MKKHVIALLGAALLVAAGCKKNEETTPNPVGEKMTFTATTGGGEKTQIDGYDMKWKGEETIYVNGKTFTANVSEDGAESAEFTGESVGLDSDGQYKAYYGVNYSDGTYSLPATQTYKDNGDLSGVNPMYAESTDENLHFYNICALVKLSVSSSVENVTVTGIEVSANEPLSGAFEIKTKTVNDATRYYASMVDGGTSTVTLNCGEGGVALTKDVAKDFYVALPDGEYTGLKFTVSSKRGETENAPKVLEAAVNDEGKTVLIADSLYTKAVKLLDFNGHEGVQLWDGGPYWATCNIGASKPEDYGDYYQWGEGTRGGQGNRNPPYTIYGNNGNTNDNNWSPESFISPITDDGFVWKNAPYYNKSGSEWNNDAYTKYTDEGPATLEYDDDVAHLLWGGDWRMPAIEEFEALKNNCTYVWTPMSGINGYRFTGKGDYSGSSVFLPATGYCNGTSRYTAGSNGYYWSRSLYSTASSAYYLNFDSSYVYPSNGNPRYYGFTVRPVF